MARTLKTLDRRGFSLIEMLTVLALVSLVAISVSLRWGGMYLDTQFQAEIERVIDVDFKARRHAVSQHQNSRLIFDLETQQLRSSRWVDGVEKLLSHRVANGNRVNKLRTVHETLSTGKVTLPVSNLGATPTYGLELTQNEKTRWIVFAGRTGQAKVIEDATEVDEIFKALRVAGSSR